MGATGIDWTHTVQHRGSTPLASTITNNTPLIMSKIESAIEFECTDWKPSDIEWTLLKKDVPEIAANIKRLLLEEIRKAPHTWEDAVETVNDF